MAAGGSNFGFWAGANGGSLDLGYQPHMTVSVDRNNINQTENIGDQMRVSFIIQGMLRVSCGVRRIPNFMR